MESKFSLYDKNYRKESPIISLRGAEATERRMRTTAISATTTSTSTTTTSSTSTTERELLRENKNTAVTVSYTHLTLPTILLV